MNLGALPLLAAPLCHTWVQASHSPSAATWSQPGAVHGLLSTKQSPQGHFILPTNPTEKLISHKAGEGRESLLVWEGEGLGKWLASSPHWQVRSHHLKAVAVSSDTDDITAIKRPNLSSKEGEEFHWHRVMFPPLSH